MFAQGFTRVQIPQIQSITTIPLGHEGQPVTIDNIPVWGRSDLRLLDHQLVTDLGVSDSDLQLSPERPLAGDEVTATLTVHNTGDFTTGTFAVQLWVGEPGVGTLVETQSVTGPFRAGGREELEFLFDLPSSDPVVAVVDALDDVAEVTDANNRAAVYLDNTAPEARVIAEITSGYIPLTVQFDGSLSSDLDNDQLEYSWVFSDGTDSATGKQATHTFTAAGQYPVTLAVQDEKGAVGIAVVMITAEEPIVPLIFADGFEAGDASRWSRVVGDL